MENATDNAASFFLGGPNGTHWLDSRAGEPKMSDIVGRPPQTPNHRGKKLQDRLMLVGAALLVIVVGGIGFLLADKFHIDSAWVLLAAVSVGFFAAVGWDFRAEFRSVRFILFFVGWLLVHLLIFVLVVGRFGWLYWLLALFLELFFFYATAELLLGLKPPLRRRSQS